MVTKSNVFQLSLFILCSFPLFISLQYRALAAIVFIVLQIALVFWQFNRSIRGIWFLLMQLIPVLFLIASLLYSSNPNLGLKKLETNTMLLLIPIVLYLNRAHFTTTTQNKVIAFFIGVSSLVSMRVIFKMLASGKLFEVMQLTGGYYFIRTSLEQLSGFHPTYFSLILAIAFLGLINWCIRGFSSPIYWLLSAVSALLLSVGLVLAMSKMVLGSFLVIVCILIAKQLNSQKLKWISVAFVLLGAVSLITIKPVQDRSLEFVDAIFNTNLNQENPDSMRKGVYRATFDVIAEYPFFGTGISDIQQELNNAYKNRGYTMALERSFNTHNNYLNWWATTGVIPAFIFLMIQLVHFGIAIANKNWLHFSVALLMSLSMLTENLLMRQDGVFIYAFFSTFFVYTSWVKYRNRVMVNGKFLSQPLTGVQRFATEICTHLSHHKANYLIASSSISNNTSINLIRVKPFNGTIWEQISLPLFMLFTGSRPLLNLCNTAPVLYRYNYTVLHDVAFKEDVSWFSSDFAKWYNFLIPKVLKHSKGVFTVSKFSKKEILKHFNIPERKISVVYNGVPKFIGVKNKEFDNRLSTPYLLMVGSISKRKNQQYVANCFANWEDAPCRLIIAGSEHKVLSKNQAANTEMYHSKNVKVVSNPSDEELLKLYKNAYGCIYTPLYEGFGIPVVEALATNNNIIVSDIPVFRELFEGYVTFARLDDEEHLRVVIKQFIDQEKPNQLNSLANIAELRKMYSYNVSANEIHNKIIQYNL